MESHLSTPDRTERIIPPFYRKNAGNNDLLDSPSADLPFPNAAIETSEILWYYHYTIGSKNTEELK